MSKINRNLNIIAARYGLTLPINMDKRAELVKAKTEAEDYLAQLGNIRSEGLQKRLLAPSYAAYLLHAEGAVAKVVAEYDALVTS